MLQDLDRVSFGVSLGLSGRGCAVEAALLCPPQLSVLGWKAPLVHVPKCNSSRPQMGFLGGRLHPFSLGQAA